MRIEQPLRDYSLEFAESHAKNVAQKFEEYLQIAGVDPNRNAVLVNEYHTLATSAIRMNSSRKRWVFARIASIVLSVVSGLMAYLSTDYMIAVWAILSLAFLVLTFFKINPEAKKIREALSDQEIARDRKLDEAWVQMDPLNRLFRWDDAIFLSQATCPEIELDSYLTTSRHADLLHNYRLSNDFFQDSSIAHIQSGAFQGNPFVINRFIQHWIGSYTYYGSLTIYWTETVRDAQGNYNNIQRSQVLTASVTKPFPEYQVRTMTLYGHESSPDLSFSRKPSKLSGTESGKLNSWRKGRVIKKVERQARKAIKSGDSSLTLMANREFEALFNATDRDNEVQFRLLFTALAQQEMVELLNDNTVYHGDDFTFWKSGTINCIESEKLNQIDLLCDPQKFRHFDLSESRAIFNNFHNSFFKGIYFGLAPLLIIPLYREERTIQPSPISTDVHESSYWEHEAIANMFGDNQFQHPESVTRNILKTSAHSAGKSTTKVTVTAYGYKGVPMVDYVSMLGGDGRIHQVPVPWVEYIPVERESKILVGIVESHQDDADGTKSNELIGNWENAVASNGVRKEHIIRRGALAVALLRS